MTTLLDRLGRDTNWWLPRWLGRLLPSIRIEEGPTDDRVPVTTGA